MPFHVQCLKLIEMTKSTHAFFINKADKKGRTALHLAAQNGDECQTMHLLRQGAQTYLTDHEGRTPLDVAIDFAQDDYFEEISVYVSSLDHDNFDFRQAINMRSHTAVADILLNEEANLTHICDGREASLLHRAFEKEKPFIADRILSMGASLSCRDIEGRTPLLIYLQSGGTWLDVVLNRHDVNFSIECGKAFNFSELHLAAFRKPTKLSDNFLEQRLCEESRCITEDGPLVKAIKAHSRGFRVIDECHDEEGYTALHIAAQGGNLIALKWFLSRGADPTVLTSQGHSALTLAILSGRNPYSSLRKREAAEKTAALLFHAMTRISPFDMGCNRVDATLTIYHLAAYAGLTGLLKTLLNSKLVRGINVNCSNVHGIRPLYLAKLNIMRDPLSDGESDPWQKIADVIEKQGGVLTYPNRKAELHLLYKHLCGSFLNPFKLESLNSKSDWFYESDVSQCTASDFDYYKTGTLINRHGKEVNSEFQRITQSHVGKFMNTKLDPRELPQLKALLKIIYDVRSAFSEFLQVFGDSLNGLERTETEVMRRRSQARYINTTSMKMPRIMKSEVTFPVSFKSELSREKQRLSEMLFKHYSANMVSSHIHKYIKIILRKHRHVLGDTRKLFQLLENFEESDLCMEEIFQADMIIRQFKNYVLRSRMTDFFSLRAYKDTSFATERFPNEWLMTFDPQAVVGWNQAVKFLYLQGTQRYDSSFDYLQAFSLGLDRNTRIPLNVETFRLD